VTQLTVR